MPLHIHTEIEGIPKDLPLAYFQKGYFQSQSYSNFLAYSNEDFFIPFDITENKAISIPRSPFGSFIRRNNDATDLLSMSEGFFENLKELGVDSIEIHHPSSIYSSFVPHSSLDNLGFNSIFTDINQHIELSPNWERSIHNMQKRKLETLRSEGFEFRKMDESEFEMAHKFLSVCRQAHGLQINVSWDQLHMLVDSVPDTYECFGVFREEKISALCIAVKVTQDIAYYYLPATSPMFRDKSPMVLLIAGMVNYYRKKGYKHLDLGISSMQGKPQETLRIFKERMGAVETSKPTFIKPL